MRSQLKTISIYCLTSALIILALIPAIAFAARVQVSITNNGPGVALTSLWVGFHDGSFDSYDSGAVASAGIESLAEVGNAMLLSGEFAAATPTGVDGSVPVLLTPGAMGTAVFDIGSNSFFSYAAMVLPSSDYFVANGNPTAHDLSSLIIGSVSEISFNIGGQDTVNDAGTEINDFAFSAGNSVAGIADGDAPNGADENGVITNVLFNPYGDFLNKPDPFDFSAFDFNNTIVYPDGIATISLAIVPLPAAFPLMLLALGLLVAFARRRPQD